MKKPEKAPSSELDYALDGRILVEMMNDTGLNDYFSSKDKDYPYWDTFKYKVTKSPYPAELLWKFMKMTREKTISRLSVSEILGFQFKYNTTNKILKSLHEFDLHLGGIMEGSSIVPSEDKNRYLISSIMEEAIASSQLEGAATTREVAKEMLRSNRKPITLSEKMILNNYMTIKKVMEVKGEKLSKDLILELHSTISKGTLTNPANEGRMRTNDDVKVVDGITDEIFYEPPTFEHLDKLITDFCEFANKDNHNHFIHPIIKGIILHFLIGYIHPFADGNGRTARAIFYWYLISRGYWLVEYMSISRVIIKSHAQYARAYLHTEYDENDLTYFLDYNIKCMDLALKELKKYIHRKIKEKQSLYDIIRHENVNERQAELLKILLVDNHKSFTIQEVQTRFGVVYQTARTDLFGLQSMGYLEEKKFGKKLVFFRIKELENKIKKMAKLE